MKKEENRQYQQTYQAFITEKRIKTNKALNIVLWCLCIAGPLISMLKYLGIYPRISYTSCLAVTVLTILLALVHQILFRLRPQWMATSLLALVAIDALIFMMTNAHMGIYITYFLVPLLSIYFYDLRLYWIACGINYATMVITLRSISPRFAADSLNYQGDSVKWFISFLGNFSIEMLIMIVVGFVLARSITKNLSKLYEEQKNSQIDVMTEIFNRRAYDEDSRGLAEKPKLPENFIYFSFDVNSLKTVNDSIGHRAGDELICGVAECIQGALGKIGKIYRIGGDEFVALVHTDESASELKQKIHQAASKWKGVRIDKLDFSTGYAESREFPDADFLALEKISDERMYREKMKYYRENATDMRGQLSYLRLLSDTYQMISKINLTSDSYMIIKSDDPDDIGVTGVQEGNRIRNQRLVDTGVVHPEDVERFQRYTSPEFQKKYFEDHWNLWFIYRRKINGAYVGTVMEVLRADDYRADNQELYYYCKTVGDPDEYLGFGE